MAEDSERDGHYALSLELHHKIEGLYPRIEEYRAYFRDMAPVDRSFPLPAGHHPGVALDQTVCALAIKAATTKRTILAVCELGDGDNAMALARVLLENACLLEWLIRGDGRRRLEAYLMFLSVEHERIAATMKRHADRFSAAGATDVHIQSDPYHRAVSRTMFPDTSSPRPTWNFDRTTGQGRPVSVKALFREIASAEYSFEHDVLYGMLGSDIVHSGPFSLFRIQRQIRGRETFTLRPIPIAEMCALALAASNMAMVLVLDSLTEYLGLDLSSELDTLKAESKRRRVPDARL